MAMIAMALPNFAREKRKAERNNSFHMIGQNKKDTDSIRENAGVHERSFLQESPEGDFVILTFEGDDPVGG